jgi:RNA polymerase sigma factor (TIGR02999 family)
MEIQPLRPSNSGATLQPTAAPEVDAERLNRLFAEVQDELRRVAHRKLAMERAGHTLSTTALVNETYLKLAKQDHVQWGDRAQFFGLAAQAMRRILIDYARSHRRMRERVQYDSSESVDGGVTRQAVRLAAAQRADEILALDEALEQLAKHDDRMCRVVECRFFAGYTEDETAAILGVTARTVSRDWAKAREWLYRALHDTPEAE